MILPLDFEQNPQNLEISSNGDEHLDFTLEVMTTHLHQRRTLDFQEEKPQNQIGFVLEGEK